MRAHTHKKKKRKGRKVHANRGTMGRFSCDFQNATSVNGSWQRAQFAASAALD